MVFEEVASRWACDALVVRWACAGCAGRVAPLAVIVSGFKGVWGTCGVALPFKQDKVVVTAGAVVRLALAAATQGRTRYALLLLRILEIPLRTFLHTDGHVSDHQI